MGTIYRNGKVNTIIKNGKIYGYASGGGGGEIQLVLLQELITQESELSITVSASSNWSGYEPWKAFGDSSVNSGWIANQSTDIWYQVEFPTSEKIKFIFYGTTDANRYQVISRVGYSDDGTNFTDCDITSSLGMVLIKDSVKAKYWRFYFDGSYGYQAYPMLSLLQLYDIDNGGGGSANLYTNADYYQQNEQITDISEFTKIYDTSIPYGNYGAKIATALGLTNESTITANMNTGWQGTGSCSYDSENQIGAYGGYEFNQGIGITKVKLWMGRYAAQNKTLIITLEYKDANGQWNELFDYEVTENITYPLNIIEFLVGREIHGIRWIHKKGEIKTSGNNAIFFGMTLYQGVGTPERVYIPSSKGYIELPTGYDGFGLLYIP